MEYSTETRRSNFCFCTAAYGDQYVTLAKLLAEDLEKFAPKSTFLIVTNRPDYFSDNVNVLAIKHRCRGVEPHHERRFAINYGLSISDTVIVIDSDVRILSPVPDDLIFEPGLGAKSCSSLQKHIKRWSDNPSKKNLKRQQVFHEMAKRVGVDSNSPDLKFINEFLFSITKAEGREQVFLETWGDLAIYADTLGMHRHPTYAMALAASKADFPIYRHEMPGLEVFDDRVTKWNIQHGKAELTPQVEQLFVQHHRIEYGKKNFFQRVRRKAEKIYYKRFSIPFNSIRVRIFNTISPSGLKGYPENNKGKF